MLPIDKWQIEKLVAQCIMPRLNIEKFFTDYAYQQEIYRFAEYGIGGFCIFDGELDKTSQAISLLQSRCEIPLIFSCDMEHAMTMRIRGATSFPHAMALGKLDDTAVTKQIAAAIAKEAKSIGISWNFAPVADINSNPDNPVINIRAYGEDKEKVAEHVRAYIEGTQSQKVMACIKHFPGHGDTSTDSHLTLPLLGIDSERLESFELYPFREGIAAGVYSVMTGHLLVPAIDSADMISLSANGYTILRNNMEYRGICITDALDMRAVTSQMNSSKAALKALQAGADIALMPEYPLDALKLIAAFAKNQPELARNLQKSVGLIIKAKRFTGLMPMFAKPEKSTEMLFTEHEKLALRTAINSIKIEDNTGVIPVKEEIQIAGFAFIQQESDLENASQFYKYLAQAIENDCDFGFLDSEVTGQDIDELLEKTQDAELIILSYFYRNKAYLGTNGLPESIVAATKKIISQGKPVITVLFGNPYIDSSVAGNSIIYTYSDSKPSIFATVMALSGRSPDAWFI